MHLATALVKYLSILKYENICFCSAKMLCACMCVCVLMLMLMSTKEVAVNCLQNGVCTLYLNCHGFLSVSYIPYYNITMDFRSISSNFNFIGALPHNTPFQSYYYDYFMLFHMENMNDVYWKRGRASSYKIHFSFSFSASAHVSPSLAHTIWQMVKQFIKNSLCAHLMSLLHCSPRRWNC